MSMSREKQSQVLVNNLWLFGKYEEMIKVSFQIWHMNEQEIVTVFRVFFSEFKTTSYKDVVTIY